MVEMNVNDPRPRHATLHHSAVRWAAIAVAAVLAITSCSDDDGTADTAAATATLAETTAEPDTAAAPDTTAATQSTIAPDATSAPTAAETEAGFDPYTQTLEWTECDLGECAEATVPIDYDDAAAGTTTIALSRLAATGPDRIGTLFVNPGGPGIPGRDLPEKFESDAPDLLAAYDIVGFDPRGVGQSDPLGCLDDAGLDQMQAADLDPDDPASVDAYTALFQGQAEACLATNPELAQHVTTVETAKDLDVLRALVGDDQLSYMGFSYGTFLGTTYAALFPDKVGRMVLDGPEDPSLSESAKALRTMSGFQRAFDNYAADCVADDCPLGASVEEIEQHVIDLFETAKDQPLPTDDAARPLTRPLLFFGIVANLYEKDQWSALTDAMATALQGDGSDLLEYADLYNGRFDGEYLDNQQAITPINCLDAKLAPPSTSAPTEDDFVSASAVFGEIAYASSAVGCDKWPIDPTVTAPDYTAAGAAPILVVGTTGDPATPIESARQLAHQMDSGVLLIRDGEGHTA